MWMDNIHTSETIIIALKMVVAVVGGRGGHGCGLSGHDEGRSDHGGGCIMRILIGCVVIKCIRGHATWL